jgi:hypothetical protein
MADTRSEAWRKLFETAQQVLLQHPDLERFAATKLEGPNRVVHDARTDRQVAAQEYEAARDDVNVLPQRAKLAVDAGQTDEAGRLVTLKQTRERDLERCVAVLEAHDNRVRVAERALHDVEYPILLREAVEVHVPAIEFATKLLVLATRNYIGGRARFGQILRDTSHHKGATGGAPGYPRPSAEAWRLMGVLAELDGSLRD